MDSIFFVTSVTLSWTAHEQWSRQEGACDHEEGKPESQTKSLNAVTEASLISLGLFCLARLCYHEVEEKKESKNMAKYVAINIQVIFSFQFTRLWSDTGYLLSLLANLIIPNIIRITLLCILRFGSFLLLLMATNTLLLSLLHKRNPQMIHWWKHQMSGFPLFPFLKFY